MPHYKDKLPWRQVLSLSSANFSQAVMLTTPFTIGVFMVRDFEAAKHGGREEEVDEQRVGRLTGLLAGIFSFSGFLTAYGWGCASNYIGRKPVIVVGNVVSYISILWFGLAGSYGSAMAARAFGGFFNGILGAWKCMIGESTDTLLQGKFFGYMSLAWGLGCIAGPALGGAFSRPCTRMGHLPGCHEGGLLRARPYLLACLVGSTTILASLLLSAFMLEETLPQELQGKGLWAKLRRWRLGKQQLLREREEERLRLHGEEEARGGRKRRRRRKRQQGAAEGGGAAVEAATHTDQPQEGSGLACAASSADGLGRSGAERAQLLRPDLQRSDDVGRSGSDARAGGLPGHDDDSDDCSGSETDTGGSSEERDGGSGGKGGGSGGQPRSPPVPNSPSVTRMGHLLRLTSRVYITGNPFARAGSWRRLGSSGSGRRRNRGGGGGVSGVSDAEDGSEVEPWLVSRSGGSASGSTSRRGDGGGRGGGGGGECEVVALKDSPLAQQRSDRAPAWAGDHSIAQPQAGAEAKHGADARPSLGPAPSAAQLDEGCPPPQRQEQGQEQGAEGTRIGTPQSLADAPLLATGDIDSDKNSSGRGGSQNENANSNNNSTPSLSAATSVAEGGGGDGGKRLAGLDLAKVDDGATAAAAVLELTPLLRVNVSKESKEGVRAYEGPGKDGENGEEGYRVAPACSDERQALLESLPEDRSHHGGDSGQGDGNVRELRAGRPGGVRGNGDDDAGVKDKGGGPSVDGERGGGGVGGGGGDSEQGGRGGDDEGNERPKERLLPWYRYPQVVLTILGYGATALLFCAVDEVFPIFAAAPLTSGGLGMREEQIAPPLMFFGAVLMPYSLYGYPWLQRKVGTLRLTRVGLLASAATCLLIPLVADIRAASTVTASVVLYVAMVFKAVAQCSAFTGSIIAVNAAPSQDQLGAVNGVGQTLAALVRGLGPALGGVLWAVSLGLHVQGQQFLTFIIIALVAVGNFFLYGFVRLPNLK